MQKKQIAWVFVPYIKIGDNPKHRLLRKAVDESMARALLSTSKSTHYIKYGVMKVPVYEEDEYVS